MGGTESEGCIERAVCSASALMGRKHGSGIRRGGGGELGENGQFSEPKGHIGSDNGY